MRSRTRILLWTCAAILVFDAVASVASRALGFPYIRAAVGSALVYAGAGIVAGRRVSIPLGALVGAAAGLVEATLGWAVSWVIGPGRWSRPLTVGGVLGTVLFVTGFGAGIAALGAVVGRAMRPRRTPGAANT